MYYRVLFLGQKSFGEKCFKYLTKSEFKYVKICGLVSNSTMKNWWGSNNIFKLKNELPFIENNKRHTCLINKMIDDFNINTIISVQHPWILDSSILKKVNYNAFNFHNAKLPEYGGNKVCSHVILNNESEHYSTAHFIDDTVDKGDIIFQKKCKIESFDTSKSLFEKGEKMGFSLFKKVISYLENGDTFPRRKILGEGNFYSFNSLKGLKEIKNINDFSEVDKKSRAFYFDGFEPAYFLLNGKKFYIYPETKKY